MIPFPAIDPIAIQLGPIAIRWYGLSYIFAIFMCWFLIVLRSQRLNLGWNSDRISDLVFYMALGGVLGGRLGYVLFYNLSSYIDAPLDIFKIWQGGMSFHGGLLGGFIAMWLFAKKHRQTFFAITDLVAPSIPIGLFAGRIANFINSELWGKTTSVPWGIVFPDPASGDLPRHPSQLYEAALEGVLLFIILWNYAKTPRPVRSITGLFLICYGCFRFLVEFVREPDGQLGYLAFDWLTMGQVLCVPMVLIGVLLMGLAYKKG